MPAVAVGTVGVSSVTEISAATNKDGNEKPTTIDDCTTITESGRYVLAEDIDAHDEATCIKIEAEDVLLDGRGHTIDGGGSGGRGVMAGELLVTDVANITVKNLGVTGFTVAGIAYEDATGGAIRNVTATDSQNGIEYQNANDISVTGSKLSENEFGVFATDGSVDNVFARNDITSNANTGAVITEFSRGHSFRRNRINDNGGSGVVLDDGSDEPKLIGNAFRDNDNHGISLFELTDARLQKNRAINNGGDGISLGEVDGSRLVKNISLRNTDDGIELVDSDNNNIIKNVVRNNGDEAIAITGTSSGNTLSGNVTD